MLLAILTAAALLVGCSTGNEGGNSGSGDTVVTEQPDERLDLAVYSLIRPDRSSGYLTDAFRGLRNNIRERFGIDMTVSDDWLLEGDYDSERVAALPEVLIRGCQPSGGKKSRRGHRQKRMADKQSRREDSYLRRLRVCARSGNERLL